MYAIWHTIYQEWYNGPIDGHIPIFTSHAYAEEFLETIDENVRDRFEIRSVKIVEMK